ncbi:MAG: thrombospondin type 3 repeat-containing protein, partial [Candidatus Omnitrophica bacterium]|nr:thrombospondin type 3 repeat-containing protein [Candidatus Omnitrophota bacterium]
DPDGDGLSNSFEYRLGSDPTKADSDGDGYNDGAELTAGTDPLNSQDNSGLMSHIYHAAEFVFTSQKGKTYQIQMISKVGSTWTNVGDPIVGTGDNVSRFISTRTENEEFYRVVEVQ